MRTRKLTKRPAPADLLQMLPQQNAWDTSKTLEQNYDRLGVRVRVNGVAGGVDIARRQSNAPSRDIQFETDLSGTLDEMDRPGMKQPQMLSIDGNNIQV